MENLLLLSFSINTDIFETNLINIVLLVAVLFNVVGDALKASMLERKEKILSGVKDAEQRLSEASERLQEAKKQLEQSKLIIDKIKSDNKTTKRSIAVSGRDRAQVELDRQTASASLTIVTKEQQVLREVKEQVLDLALGRVLNTLKDDLTLDRHITLLDDSIARIGGL